ncbi:uncharacterized protein At4g29660-like [Panicum virgatum]|uniref:Uncharacterized protein n=1 Tax=Panicum virgatum TaxID=38727 RepID=A0A8T0UZI7_PANVG|nr:uncharacterized protein At4g29660-like [Panicum virgatum]KAG2626103.1 hypothetical protein PVAP13_3KG321100 [Panicum virgatum]
MGRVEAGRAYYLIVSPHDPTRRPISKPHVSDSRAARRRGRAASQIARARERGGEAAAMSRHFWRWYADRQFHKWEKTVLWDMVEPYRPPRSFAPLVGTYVAAFYTGVVGAAVTEQLYKEKYWEEHPGEAVPIMPPKFYWGPWRVMNGEVPRFIQSPEEAKTA